MDKMMEIGFEDVICYSFNNLESPQGEVFNKACMYVWAHDALQRNNVKKVYFQ